jgi:transposase-like protein
MTLKDLSSRIGPKALARRLGISPRTLALWIRRGPSRKGAAIVEAVLRRSAAAFKAAESRKRQQRFRESLQPPPQTELPPSNTLPRKPPTESREGQRISKRREVGQTGRLEVYETDRYLGERQWITIGQPVLDVSVQALIDSILHNWELSGHTWNFVNFLFFRYIPFNPIYTGELMRLQGKWLEWWTRTPTRGTIASITDAIKAVFLGYPKREGTKLVNIKGALEMAQTRMIWLESIQVVNFTDKADL